MFIYFFNYYLIFFSLLLFFLTFKLLLKEQTSLGDRKDKEKDKRSSRKGDGKKNRGEEGQ